MIIRIYIKYGNDVCFCCTSVVSYCLFFHCKLKQIFYFFLAVSEKIKEIDKFISNCDLNRLMQELIGNYIMMEEFFMREMVLKVCYKVLDKSETQTFVN